MDEDYDDDDNEIYERDRLIESLPEVKKLMAKARKRGYARARAEAKLLRLQVTALMLTQNKYPSLVPIVIEHTNNITEITVLRKLIRTIERSTDEIDLYQKLKMYERPRIQRQIVDEPDSSE